MSCILIQTISFLLERRNNTHEKEKERKESDNNCQIIIDIT